MAEKIIVGQIELSFHTAAAAVVVKLLEELGHEVVIKEYPHEEMYNLHSKGEVDLVCSAWLPDSHGVYLNKYHDDVKKLAVIYEPYCIWGIPDSLPKELISIEQLAEEKYAKLFNRLIQGIGSGAGISRFSRQIISDYNLDSQGFYFENGSLDDCTNVFLDNLDSDGLQSIIPLWHPQWINSYGNLRELKDPKGLLGGRDQATLIIRKDAIKKISNEGMNLLNNIYLGNNMVSQLDYSICRDQLTASEAADIWISENRDICNKWSCN